MNPLLDALLGAEDWWVDPVEARRRGGEEHRVIVSVIVFQLWIFYGAIAA